MKAARTCVVALLAVLLTGCTSTLAGTPSVDRVELKQYQDDNAPLTTQRAFGDLTTIDYCSLLDVGTVKDNGAQVGVDPVSAYTYCALDASLGGTDITVTVGWLQSDDKRRPRVPDTSRELKRGLSVVKDASGGSYSCQRFLKFADGVLLEVYVDSPDTTSTTATAAMCQVDEAVLDHVIDTVEQNKPVSHQTYPQGSLGTLDACSLVADSDVTGQLPGVQKNPLIPTQHWCRWDDGGSRTLSVYFDIDQPYPGPVEQLAGRTTTVSATGTTFCIASTTIGPAPGTKQGEVQMAQVYSYGTSGDICAPVRAVANLVWPKLPAA